MKLNTVILFIVALLGSSLATAQNNVAAFQENIDLRWVVVAGALVFLMQAGFGLLESGMVPNGHI